MNKLVKGGLAVAGGAVAAEGLRRLMNSEPQPKYEPWERSPYKEFSNRVLVVGGGFAGYTVAKTLGDLTGDRDDVGVMVIDRENFFTYWPMVAGIISSDVETKNVAQPLRRALVQFGASFRRAELESVDFEHKVLKASGGLEFPYDHLVLALGADPAFFGIPGVEEHSISMKGLTDAERIRNRVIERFEEVTLARDEASETDGDDEIPESKLTFVVIGGGSTGVEIASELHALAHKTLAPDYPNIDLNRVKIVLVDSNEEVLKELDPALRRAARRHLEELEIKVINEVRAEEVTADKVILDDGEEIETENVVWTADCRARRVSRRTSTCSYLARRTSGPSATARPTWTKTASRSLPTPRRRSRRARRWQRTSSPSSTGETRSWSRSSTSPWASWLSWGASSQ